LFEEVMDWQRCLMLGFMSNKVAAKVSESYLEAANKRNEIIASKISETLKDDEAGLLFIREEHSVQFPNDVEVFTIFPPALDEIHRWLRDQARMGMEKATGESRGEAEKEAEEETEEISKKAKTRAKRRPKDRPDV
jgi:hypothetical protein